MRIQRVIAGLDFSSRATDAARWVASAFAPDAELVLAHVVDVPRAPDFSRGLVPPSEQVAAAARGLAETQLREIATGLTARSVRTVVRVGRAHEELARLATELGADLVVVGPHGDRPRPWKMLGTTAERLARAASPAVLVASGFTSAAPARVLVAVDDGPARSAVLAWAKGLADDLDAEITVLHVLPDTARSHVVSMAAATTRSDVDRMATVSADVIGEATRWLELLAANEVGPRRTEAVVARGHAGDLILETARDVRADLIVLGRRGTSTLIPAVLGSTVSTVLHGASCPVLVVTEHETEWEDAGAEA